MDKKVTATIAVLGIGLGLVLILLATPPALDPVPHQPLLRTVRALQVEAITEHLVIQSQGTVQPRNQSELIPEVSGRVKWISQALVGGGTFRAGDTLLRLESDDYDTALQRSQASLDRAEVEHEYSLDELKRLEKLHAKKLASQSQLDKARRSARVAAANLADSRASLDQSQRDLARTEIKAPFDGRVRQESVDLGQFVSRGNSIGTIYATDYIEVRLPIAGDQLSYLGLPLSHRGQIMKASRPGVTLLAEFGSSTLTWTGELVRTEAEIDERSRMLYAVARVEISKDDDTTSAPVGLFVQARIQGRKVDNIVRLPRSSMRDSNQVLVIDSDNKLRFREVSILRLEHDDVLLNQGLEDGELVCVSAVQTVVDGMTVKPVIE